MSREEAAELAFMRWVASLSSDPWVPRRPSAERLWEAIRLLVSAWSDIARDDEVSD